MIAPAFESLSTKYSKPGKITFCKVNVDNQQPIAQAHGVRAMPTFLIFKNGSVIETIQGANPPALTAAVEKAVKLAGTAAAGASFHTPGRTLGGPSGTAPRRGGGQTLGRPSAWRFDSFKVLNALLTFVGLYFVTLFSVSRVVDALRPWRKLTVCQFDPYKAAENSDFNVHKPRDQVFGRGSGGQKVGGQAAPKGAPRPGAGVRTLADLGGS